MDATAEMIAELRERFTEVDETIIELNAEKSYVTAATLSAQLTRARENLEYWISVGDKLPETQRMLLDLVTIRSDAVLPLDTDLHGISYSGVILQRGKRGVCAKHGFAYSYDVAFHCRNDEHDAVHITEDVCHYDLEDGWAHE